MTFLPPLALMVFNIVALWLLMAAPVGKRTISRTGSFKTTPEAIWAVANPHSQNARQWQHDIHATSTVPGDPAKVEIVYTKPDRHGRAIRRVLNVDIASQDIEHYACQFRVIDDSTLDASFWHHYRETREVETRPGGATLTISRTDHYRGYGFLLMRYIILRNEVSALQEWVETGRKITGRRFTSPLIQTGLALLSTLLLWPFFGLTSTGLLMSALLTIVIVLHELGHMAAYRTFGHLDVRMIFVPLLGGIAIGGRPYKNRFEIASCALMGPGMSAFLVPIIVAAGDIAGTSGMGRPVLASIWLFLLILGSFNLLNLLPMNRFDGGQVIRQVFTGHRTRLIASFCLTLAILWVGARVEIAPLALIGGLAVFILLSMISGARPKVATSETMDEMTGGERLMAGFGLYAAIMLHGYAIIHACDRLFP